MTSLLKLISESGKGRAFVLLYERSSAYGETAKLLSDALSEKSRVLLVETQTIKDTNWQLATAELEELMLDNKIRQVSVVAFGATGAVAQHFCLRSTKGVRTLILMDVAPRAHPSALSKFIDKLESSLPLGLPLRSRTAGFDGKPFLQRIRCPVLILTSSKASSYERTQAHVLAENLPVSWYKDLSAESDVESLRSLILEFQDVRAKCPQKGLRKQVVNQ